MNKLDDFFKDRLTDFTPGDKDWNVPSETLWEKALPHLPKKKKKRFGILWFLLGVFVAGGLGVLYISNANNQWAGGQKVAERSVKINNEKPRPQEFNQELGQNSIAPSKAEELSTAKNKNANAVSENSKVDKSNILNDKPVPTFILNEAIQNENIDAARDNNISNVENIRSESIKSSRIIRAKTQAGSEFLQINEKERAEEKEDRPALLSEFRDLVLLTKLSFIPAPLSGEESNVAAIPRLELAPVRDIAPIAEVGRPSEIGLSYTHLLLALIGDVELETTGPMDQAVLSGNYNNINLEYSKWLGNRWSFTTGAYLSRLDMLIDLCIFDELDSDDLESFVESNVDDILPRNDIASQQRLELLDGVELIEGDVLAIKGQVGLDIKAVQIPLLINYHWNKRRTEFYVGAGLSLERLWFNQSSAEVTISKEGSLITEPYVQQEESEAFWEYSIYTQFGARYRISPKFNLGLGVKVSVLDPVFSGINAGIYYRWHK